MINLTDRPILLDVDNADKNIRNAITTVIASLDARNGAAPESVQWKYIKFAFQWHFRPSSIKDKARFDGSFIQTVFDFAAPAVHESTAIFNSEMPRYTNCKPVPAHAIQYLRAGFKQLLVLLWSRKVILLPTVFVTGSAFAPLVDENELYSFVREYKQLNEGIEANTKDSPNPSRNLITCYMTRVLWATDWSDVEDVSIYELGALHRAQRAYISGEYGYAITTSPVPWTMFLNELIEAFPGRTSYTKNQVVIYAEWLHGAHSQEHSFSEYEALRNKLRISLAEEKRLINQTKRRVKYKATSRPTSGKESLVDLTVENSHEAALNYFKTLSPLPHRDGDWLKSDLVYPGREHVHIADLSDVWKTLFRSYLSHRKNIKGYETDGDIISALKLLADYLFLYLPWWNEIYPEYSVTIPRTPKELTRFVFVARHGQEPSYPLPTTLTDIIKLRRHTPESERAVLSMIEKFFSFVESHYVEDDSVAGPRFRNPISRVFDLPRIKKRTKTSKIPFEKNVYGFLVHYGYAVEAFGEFLQMECFAGDFDANRKSVTNARWFDTEKYGFVPFFRHRGKTYPLKIIPNVFLWHERTFYKPGLQSEKAFVPHLTCLRLLVGAIEVGLRLMGLKWLDRRAWDKNNKGAPDISQFSSLPSDKYVYSLFVNTDKTKDEAWETSVVYRVRSLLLREQKFQLSIDEPDMNIEVPYDKRDSRFEDIVPLFRSASTADTIADYTRDWVRLMVGFQEFYNEISEHPVQFVKLGKMCALGSSEPKVAFTKTGLRFCPLSVTTINTPHACRATFATSRQGLLELSDLADLLGHESTAVTEYYQRKRAMDLSEKLEGSDREMLGGFHIFDKDDAGFIRADKPDSALVRSFNTDREGTILRFGFMPSATLWRSEIGELDEEGIDLLRNGPMSLIRFRETHICPVGEECPMDVVEDAGEPKRCGICPLAMKCVDHLRAISAKCNALYERITYLTLQSKRLAERGEIGAADAIWQEAELDANEFAGWKVSEEVLTQIYKNNHLDDQDKVDGDVFYHVDRPDIVRRHLEVVSRDTPIAEFILMRIAESNAYPSLQSPQVQAVAVQISRKLMAGDLKSNPFSFPGPDDVTVAAGLLKTLMKSNMLTVASIVEILADTSVTLPSTQFLHLGDGND